MAVVLATLFLAVTPSSGQKVLLGPSTSEHDVSSLFANPALTTFQAFRVGVGAKSYHQGLGETSGLSDIRQGYFVVSKPNLFRWVVGSGVGVQYFDSPGFQRMKVSGMIAARFLRFVSFGVEVGVVSLSYNESEFNLLDQGDPVLAEGLSASALTISPGVYVRPLHLLAFSAGIRNMNNPNTSLVGATVPNASEPYAGVTVSLGAYRIITEFISTINGVEPSVMFAVGSTDGNYFRVGANVEAEFGAAEAQYRLGRRLLVNYQYEMPYSNLGEVSSGSHRAGLTFEFGSPPPPDFVPPVPRYFAARPDTLEPVWQPKAHVAASTDIFTIYEKVLERRVSSNVPESALATLTERDLGTLDSTFFFAEQDLMQKAPVPIQSLSLIDVPISGEYERALNTIAQELVTDSTGALDIVVSLPAALGKASTFKNLLLQNPGVSDAEVRLFRPDEPDSLTLPGLTTDMTRSESFKMQSFTQYEPDSTRFEILPIYFEREDVRSWTFEVSDLNGDIVHSVGAGGPVPSSIGWDWRRPDGEYIDAGVYVFHLTGVLSTGERFESRMRRLISVRNVRRVIFEVDTLPPGDKSGIRNRELIIRTNQ